MSIMMRKGAVENYRIVPAGSVASARDDISSGTALVVGDPDGVRAASVAAQITGNRTAVFVGNLASNEDRRAAEEMATEVFFIRP